MTCDAEKFAQFLREHHPFLDSVTLESPGGEAREAMKIGRMIRKHLIKTRHELTGPWCNYRNPDCHCSSSCFLIWSAGIERSGTNIGLHRAIPTDLADMTLDRASASYRQAMTEVESYLKEMEVPSRFFQIIESTASSDVRWLSSEETESLRKVPSIAEWLVAECGKTDYVETGTGRVSPRWVDAVECTIRKITRTRDAIR